MRCHGEDYRKKRQSQTGKKIGKVRNIEKELEEPKKIRRYK